MRTGLIAQKIGMSRIFSDDGRHIPVTVLKVENCQVISHLTKENDGYTALQLGLGNPKIKRVSKSMRGHFAKAKVEPKRKLAEFKVDQDALVEVGAEISVDHFVVGQFVDVSGTSIGKGFAGAMKRHGFGGGPKTHGQREHPRSAGSIGQASDPSRVFKGMKMAGQYGNKRITTRNLEVINVDVENNKILIKGAVPGSNNGIVYISK